MNNESFTNITFHLFLIKKNNFSMSNKCELNDFVIIKRSNGISLDFALFELFKAFYF